MSLRGKKVLVCGGTGMAGSAIVRTLLGGEPSVRVRASYNQTPPFNRDERVEYVQCDLTSARDCQALVSGCDLAVMAAANTVGAAGSTSVPWEQINPNLAMNATLLKEAAESGIQRLIVVGTASLYQDFAGAIKEDQLDLNVDPPAAFHGIGWVARYVEKLCSFWCMHSDMRIVVIRASNIYGPWARFDARTSNFIPALIRKAADHMDPFEVWGSPEVTRDVIYVEDFARSVSLMLDIDDFHFNIFNIGSGVRSTVADVVECCLTSARHAPSRVVYANSAPRTASFRALDCTKARTVLGWEPQISLEQGISATSEWWKENKLLWKR
jgi:nucleoside-diphosphate-sugar epimerase